MTLFPDDVFVASYPKSGSTWARFMLANYLSGNQCNFKTVSRLLPDVHGSGPDDSLPRPRFIKSHYACDASCRRAIYIARDGRDVAVSYYFHALRYRRIPDNATFSDFLNLFHQGQVDSYGPWGDHVLSWLNGDCERFLLLRYEDIRQDPASCLESMLAFAGVEIDVERVRTAVAASSFERMQDIERAQRNEITQWAHTNPDIAFVRRGVSGDCRQHFTPEQFCEFERYHGDALVRLGYELKEPCCSTGS